MTIALGINFGEYALLASDFRVTAYNFDRTVNSYDDRDPKKYCHQSQNTTTNKKQTKPQTRKEKSYSVGER